MDLTLAEAAKAVKMTKQGVLNAINKGKLSASKDVNGQWRIDSAELFRVYPAAKSDKPTVNQELMSGDAGLVRELTAKLEAAADSRHLLEARIEGLERERDAWQRQAEVLLRALPAKDGPGRSYEASELQRQSITQAQSGPKRSFWRRVFGGGSQGE